jgi:hypothetical protein
MPSSSLYHEDGGGISFERTVTIYETKINAYGGFTSV